MSIRAAIRDVSVRLGSVQALDSVSLAAEPGKFVALLGPSGSGKTTTLNVLAGFIQPDHGSVRFDGVDVTGVAPNERNLGIVFQSYALFPHMSVGENVEFPLRMRKVPAAERRRRAGQALESVGLGEHAARPVATLSGGQKQRVALARAVVFEPRMLLLDEPLAALDKQLRDSMQLELKSLQRRFGITTVAVTHDQVEALTMADVVVVLRDGRVEQIASPEELYLRPKTIFVAGFLGEANLLPVDDGALRGFGALARRDSGTAVIRPEHLSVSDHEPSGDRDLTAPAVIQEVTFQGARVRVLATLRADPAVTLTVSQPSASTSACLRPGELVQLVLDREVVHLVRGDDTAARGRHGSSSPAPESLSTAAEGGGHAS